MVVSIFLCQVLVLCKLAVNGGRNAFSLSKNLLSQCRHFRRSLGCLDNPISVLMSFSSHGNFHFRPVLSPISIAAGTHPTLVPFPSSWSLFNCRTLPFGSLFFFIFGKRKSSCNFNVFPYMVSILQLAQVFASCCSLLISSHSVLVLLLHSALPFSVYARMRMSTSNTRVIALTAGFR